MCVAFECVATHRIRRIHIYSIYIKYICKYIYILYTRCCDVEVQGVKALCSFHPVRSVSFRLSISASVRLSVRLSVSPVAVCRPERCSPAVVPYLLFFAVPFCLALTLITNDGALFSLAPSLALGPGPVPFACPSLRVFCLPELPMPAAIGLHRVW